MRWERFLVVAIGAVGKSSVPAGEELVEKFASETESLMNILVDSLYTDKDVFLREVLSNSNDAIERDRVQRLSSGLSERDYRISVLIDDQNDRLYIEDNGVGMCREELRTQLGTIANSGTRQKLMSATNSSSVNPEGLIGQFGVGFYSTFLVSEAVVVHSKCAAESQINAWHSVNRSHFKIAASSLEAETIPVALTEEPSGTVVELKIKKDLRSKYLQKSQLKAIVKKHSKFVKFPVSLRHLDKASGEEETEEQEVAALWLREPAEISDAEYVTFYQNNWGRKDTPLGHIHFRAEGKDFSFTALLYIPARKANEDVFNDLDAATGEAAAGNFQFYIQRVLVNENRLLPGYLNFVFGVVDSSDSKQLKVDRQGLRDSSALRRMKRKVLMKTFDMFKSLPKDQYRQFWRGYAQNLALGCTHDNDAAVKRKILDLFRFPLIHAGSASADRSDTELVSLQEYVDEHIRPGHQSRIFYYGGELEETPLLEIFQHHNVSVLRAAGPFDESCLTQNYRDFELHSIEKAATLSLEELARFEVGADEAGVLKRTTELEKELKAVERLYKPLLQRMRAALGHFIEVKISSRLVRSPFMISVPEHGFTANYEKMLRTQIGGSTKELRDVIAKMKILELNPRHPISLAILRLVQEDGSGAKTRIQELTKTILQTALIAAGHEPTEPAALTSFLTSALAEAAEAIADDELHIPSELYTETDDKSQVDSEEEAAGLWDPSDMNDEL